MSATVSPSDLVTMDLGGRSLASATLAPEERFAQPVPDIEMFRDLAAAIRRQSTLVALKAETIGAKSRIYAAYARDLALLRRCHAEFQEGIRAAVRCSITGIDRMAAREWEQAWQVLSGLVPSVEPVQPIRLPHTLAAKPIPELVAELQAELNRGIERTLKPLADWLQLLAEEELIGVVEWSDVDVCCYSYFRHQITHRVAVGAKREETTFEAEQPFGQRTKYRILRDRTTTTRYVLERHVHHVVDAKLHRLPDYPHPVPPHVAMFLDAVPDSLAPYLHVVEGTITMEERRRRLIGEKTTTETEVLSVYKGSPGVLLGPFNFIGWSSDDLASGGVFSRRQLATMKRRGKPFRERLARATGHLFTP